MKGPYERLKYDLRRVWECPQCQGRQRTDGTITGLVCNCQHPVVENERVSMKLIRDDIRRSSVKQPTGSPPTELQSDDKEVTTEATTSATPTDEAASTERSDQPAEAKTLEAEDNATPSQGEKTSENSAQQETSNDHNGPG